MGESLSEPIDQEVGCVQGSPSGPLLFSLLVNNISEALNLGKIVCYADDSYLIFEGDSWDKGSFSQAIRTSTLNFQHWQFTSMLKWNVNVELIGLILSCQHWSSTSTLKSFVNVEIESWGQMAMLKFNVEVLIACENEPLRHNLLGTHGSILPSPMYPFYQRPFFTPFNTLYHISFILVNPLPFNFTYLNLTLQLYPYLNL